MLAPIRKWIRNRRHAVLEREAAECLFQADEYEAQAHGWRGLAERFQHAGLKGPAFEARCWAEKFSRMRAKAHEQFTIARMRMEERESHE